MLIRSYYNESGDMWVCVIDENRAFVAHRPIPVLSKWKLSYRRWVGPKLEIKELGEFDTLEQAQQSVNLSIEATKKVYYSQSSSKSSSINSGVKS